ncbi:MAG: DUF2807 domain-containing protein [Spirochaetales bacterium]|nr:DUF2807 domain-containing protein [Spirochaetales bacterium]
MKTSTKVLGSALILLMAIGSVGIIASRLYLNRHIDTDSMTRGDIILEDSETINFEIDGFDEITFMGAWEVDITRGSSYEVTVEGPGNLLGEVEFKQTGSKLTVRNDFKPTFGSEGFHIRITLPELKGIVIDGGADLSLDGFTGETLNVSLLGAGRIRAFDSRYENLKVVCAGAGQLDLTDLESRNAEMNLSGAGEVLLNMNGGELSGSLSGMGSIKYKGRIGKESIRVSGLGEVSPR